MAVSSKKKLKSVSLKPKKPETIYTYPNGAAVYAGLVPHGAADSKKPVVVFVPGLGKSAQFFWGRNSMYESAYFSGFRTAFVSFNLPGKQSQDMWSNGKILARQLADICSYYHVPRVVIVAHSKGGVDAQTAAVNFDAAGIIDSIVTLSTPHWGSQLADIAYSTAGWPFAELIREHSPGCFAMQTGCMREFRRMIDKRPQNITTIKTFAGNGGTDEFSRMWAGSLMLDRYGENDGVVTVKSAHNPKGEHLGTFHFNHAQMGDGHFIWPHLEPVLEGTAQEPVVAASASPSGLTPICSAHIIKGGQLEKGVNESFNVDGTVESFIVAISLAGGTQPIRFVLTAPDGHKTALAIKRNLNGVIMQHATVEKPQVGKWKLTVQPSKGAYYALISLRGKDVFCACPKTAVPGKIRADLRILRTYTDGYDVVGEYSFKNGMELPVTPKLSNGIYTAEMRLTGELDDGSTYERSLIRPFTEGDNLNETLSSSMKPRE